MTLFFAAQSGINYITCAGTYESSLTEALELLVIDDELAGMVKRALEGIKININTLAIEQIKEIATTGKNYLGLKHSVKNTRKELFIPKIANRERYGKWQKDGFKDIMITAREKVDEILETQQGPGLSPEVEKELAKYTKKVSLRTMDDYRKMEGMDKSEDPGEFPD